MIYYNMPRKSKRNAQGAGFIDFVKKVGKIGCKVYDTGKAVSDKLKATKALSKIANAAGSLGVPMAGQIGAQLESHGYGRKRRVNARSARGGGVIRRIK